MYAMLRRQRDPRAREGDRPFAPEQRATRESTSMTTRPFWRLLQRSEHQRALGHVSTRRAESVARE